MSCWIVSKKHIDVLVHSIGKYVGTDTSADQLGHLLWKQNYDSYNTRYSQADKVVPEYHYREPEEGYTVVALIKQCRCYSYQSCETEDWSDTEACHEIEALESSLISSLPGYEEAPWGLD